MLGTKRRFFGNIVGHAKGVSDPSSLSSWTAEAFDQSLDWERIAQAQGDVGRQGDPQGHPRSRGRPQGRRTSGPMRSSCRTTAGGSSTARCRRSGCCDPIVDAVGDKIEVHLDSGIRSGQDVLKAVAMGAKGTMIGRAYIYGLGAMGQAGVTKALEVIHKELDTSMALCGHRDINQVTRDILRIPEDFEGKWV